MFLLIHLSVLVTIKTVEQFEFFWNRWYAVTVQNTRWYATRKVENHCSTSFPFVKDEQTIPSQRRTS